MQQRMDILMDAFNNPIEAFLEYEPWTVTGNKEGEFDKGNSAAQDLDKVAIQNDPNKLSDIE